MRAWLLTWNPKYGRPADLANAAKKVQAGRRVREDWSCSNTKSIRPGDRVFLICLGHEPRGIVGSGFATDSPRKRGSFAGRHPLYVALYWNSLLDVPHQPPLPLSKLQQGKLRHMNWSTQASGIEIPPEIVPKLEGMWDSHYRRISHCDPVVVKQSDVGDAGEAELAAFEGEMRKSFRTHRRRESSLRNAKIADAMRANRLHCQVPGCGFDFKKKYGELGAGFAEVHHLRPLSKVAGRVRTTLDDLAIVCANCHRMIHLHGKCRRLDTLIRGQR